MRYSNPRELKLNREMIKDKFSVKPGKRFLTLKGRNLDIFKKYVLGKDAKVLDLGTGSGAFLKVLSDLGFSNLFGADIDEYLDIRFKNLVSDFRIFDASFDPFPYNDAEFDVITAWEVFEHLENPHNAIREIRRILKKGGFLIFSMPNIFHIVSRLIFLKKGLFPKWNETNNHISLFPRGIFEKVFLRYFDLVEEGFVHSKISLPLLNKIKFLPENKLFGNWVYYVLKKKE